MAGVTDKTRRADIFLETGDTQIGFGLARDENGRLRWFPTLAPKLAPQVRQDSVSYTYLPPEVDVAVALESWAAGAGFTEATPTDVAPSGYNYSQGVDLSWSPRAYLSPEKQSANASTGGAVAAAPTGFWDSTLGVFMRAGAYIYKWDTSSLTWVLKDNASADGQSYTDIMEMNSVLYAARGNTVDYKYSTDGETWTAFTDADRNFFKFVVRGAASALPVMWGLQNGTANGYLRNTTNGRNGGVAWSAGDSVAHTSEEVVSLVEANDDLYVFTRYGIYRYTGTTQESVWTGGRRMYHTTNGANAFLWEDGRIYTTYGGRLLAFDPLAGTLNFIYPTDAMVGNTELAGTVTALAGDGDWLYAAVKNVAGNTYIMKGKPASDVWHSLLYLGANDCNAMQVFGGTRIHSANPVLMFGYGTDAKYVILPRAGVLPQDDTNYCFDTTEGVVVWPWLSVGTKQFDKLLNAGRVIAENCTAGMPVSLLYETDASGSFTTAVSAITSGVTATSVSTEVRFNRVRAKVTMTTPDNSTGPRLLGALFDTVLLVPRKRMWVFDVEIAPVTSLDASTRWGDAEQEEFLFGVPSQRVVLYDLRGRTYTTTVQSVQGVDPLREGIAGNTEVYRVTLTEIVETTEGSSPMVWDRDAWSERVWG